MVYDWEGKEDDCYRLYIEENKSLDELAQFMKEKYNFEPSKRAFQVQFKRWDFPSKHSQLSHDTGLVERIQQLWGHNSSQKQMLDALNAEGYGISRRQFYRLRARNGWLLRGDKTYKESVNGNKMNGKRRRQTDEEDEPPPVQQEFVQTEQDPHISNQLELSGQSGSFSEGTNIAQQKYMRRQEFQQRSDELWASKKRRRRTRGYGGLGADPPGPPRFPSETTLDESKAFLHLSNEQYQELRDHFQGICEENSVIRKTAAGPEKWQVCKDRLVNEYEHLRREFFGPWNGVPEQSKVLALDVICMDVTKRMRSAGRRMTIPEAKNVLGVNPAEAREIRALFYDILRKDDFVSKVEAGSEHWNMLKHSWYQSSSIIQSALSSVGPDGHPVDERTLAERTNAVDVLCRDVMKRFRDDLNKADPSFKKQIDSGPGPGPVHRTPGQKASSDNKKGINMSDGKPRPAVDEEPSSQPEHYDTPTHPYYTTTQQPSTSMQEDYASPASAPPPTNPYPSGTAPVPTLSQPVAALFRLHPSSNIQASKTMYMGTLSSGSLMEIVSGATGQYGGVDGREVAVKRIEGIISNESGAEAPFPIQNDQELMAYLSCVGDGRIVFNLLLESYLT